MIATRPACQVTGTLWTEPATWPEFAMWSGVMQSPATIGRTVNVPPFHSHVWHAFVLGSPAVPRMVPLAFTLTAQPSVTVGTPPGRPRSCSRPLAYRNGCSCPDAVSAQPTAWPAAYVAVARLFGPP